MGYSCTQKANLVLDQLAIQLRAASGREIETSNGFRWEDYDCFWEIGREQADGAITGTVWHVLDDGRAMKSGSFRIDPDGKIARFPHTSHAMRWTAYQAGMGKYQQRHNIAFMAI